jgi:hypothetical protein
VLELTALENEGISPFARRSHERLKAGERITRAGEETIWFWEDEERGWITSDRQRTIVSQWGSGGEER